jgi:hypothetical protein
MLGSGVYEWSSYRLRVTVRKSNVIGKGCRTERYYEDIKVVEWEGGDARLPTEVAVDMNQLSKWQQVIISYLNGSCSTLWVILERFKSEDRCI